MIRRYALPLIAAAAASIPAPIFAKDSLGVFANWAAFRDANVMRCYAIAKPEPSNLSREYEPFASVGSWPKRNIRTSIFKPTRRFTICGPANYANVLISRKIRNKS